jgi:nudix-type nucleoside diphosphatase (YffH/AdpP family)
MKKVIVAREVRLLDDCFKVDEALLTYERFDGTMSSPVRRLCFERGDSVAAIVFNRDKQNVILVEQFRYPAFRKGEGWLLEVAAGSVPPHETPEAALRREVREEIGYDIDRLHPIATFYPSPGGSSERVMLFCGEVTDSGKVAAGGGLAEAGENIRTIELSLQTLEDDLMHARFCDAKTLIAVMWLLNKRSEFSSPG